MGAYMGTVSNGTYYGEYTISTYLNDDIFFNLLKRGIVLWNFSVSIYGSVRKEKRREKFRKSYG